MLEINSHSIISRVRVHALRKPRFKYTNSGAMVHRRLVYIYLLNVPSFSSRYYYKIKRTSRLGRLLALSLEILFARVLFSRNFTKAEFREKKTSRNSENSLSFTDLGKSCQTRDFLANVSLTLFAKIKFLN